MCGVILCDVLCLQIFLEQKKMLKTGLNIARFRTHIGMIVEETVDYFERWGSNGTKGMLTNNALLIIFVIGNIGDGHYNCIIKSLTKIDPCHSMSPILPRITFSIA